MTMVLCAGNHDFMVQVSDRRLIDAVTAKTVTDDAIKAVAYCNFMAVAYTGLARLEGQRTDAWIAEQLKAVSNPAPGTVASKLRESATAAFSSHGSRYSHAFMGIGWAPLGEGDELHPFVARVSNFHDKEGNRLSGPRRSFVARISYSTFSERFCVASVGQTLDNSKLKMLIRTIRRGLARGMGQQGTMRLLADSIRDVANREASVGKNLLAACYPVGAVDQNELMPSVVIKGEPREDEVSFHDLRHGAAPSTLYRPHIVGPGYGISNLRFDMS